MKHFSTDIQLIGSCLYVKSLHPYVNPMFMQPFWGYHRLIWFPVWFIYISVMRMKSKLHKIPIMMSASFVSRKILEPSWHSTRWCWSWPNNSRVSDQNQADIQTTTLGLIHIQIDGLVQDCSNSSALAMELLQSCTKPSKLCQSRGYHCYWCLVLIMHVTLTNLSL